MVSTPHPFLTVPQKDPAPRSQDVDAESLQLIALSLFAAQEHRQPANQGLTRCIWLAAGLDYDVGTGRSRFDIKLKEPGTISPRKEFGAAAGKGRAVCELQRLHFTSPDGVRLAREFWEILRRKKGCTLNRLYRSANDEALWLAYSEWDSLTDLAGARREAARSPLNRRLHSLLKASSERAFEPFGPVHSVHGVNFAAAPTAMLVNFLEEMDEPEAALGFLAEAPGHISHLLLHEVGKSKTLACFAHFDTQHHAEEMRLKLSQESALQDFQPAAELFMV